MCSNVYDRAATRDKLAPVSRHEHKSHDRQDFLSYFFLLSAVPLKKNMDGHKAFPTTTFFFHSASSFFFFYLKDRKFVFFFFLRADEDRVCTRRPSFAHVSSSTFSFFFSWKKSHSTTSRKRKRTWKNGGRLK